MKRVFNFRTALVAVATIFTTFIASAGNPGDPVPAVADFKFIGKFRNKPVFELSFTNSGAGKDYVLTIRDEQGTSLYREIIGGNVLNKKYMINTDEIDDVNLKVEISSRKNNHHIVYEISRNSLVTDEIVIEQINQRN